MYQCHACPDYTVTRLAQQGGPDSPRPAGPVCPLFARMDAGKAVRDAEHALTIRRTLEALPALREAREYVLTHTYLPPLPSRGYTPVVVF